MKAIIRVVFGTVLSCLALGAVSVMGLLYFYGRDLPNYQQLRDYSPSVTSRVYADSGCLLAEYAEEKRIFLPYHAIPKNLSNAFIAAEDSNFWNHYGVDILPLMRAFIHNVTALIQGKRPQGASTITQQVAKNFFLTNQVSLERKIKEAILAFRIERTLSKEKILELYLNEIYLGHGSYGVAAAALSYFDTSLDNLTLSQVAFLAALPKAPNNYHPTRHPDRALKRRNWVLSRMLKEGYIGQAEYGEVVKSDLQTRRWQSNSCQEFAYFKAEVGKRLTRLYGSSQLYNDGLTVHTSLNRKLQEIADNTLRQALVAYDRKQGWRGPLTHLATPDSAALSSIGPHLDHWPRAVVTEVYPSFARLLFADRSTGILPILGAQWAIDGKQSTASGKGGKDAKHLGMNAIVKKGDVILVEKITDSKQEEDRHYGLRQVPQIEGAIVALDPHSGRVLAMSGGFSWHVSQFNRATQAQRQPGSAFKPIVYLAALEHGFQPNSIILDAPFVVDQGKELGRWKPKNYTDKFYGPTPLRIGLEKSRNLMTIRLARQIGLEAIAQKSQQLRIGAVIPNQLSTALGAVETRLLDLTSAYSVFVNGGKQIIPSLVDRVQDRNGKTILRRDKRLCRGCQEAWLDGQRPPYPDDRRLQIIDPVIAYQITSMLEGVVQRGTGRRIKSVGKPLAGKTGTTNDNRDAWFVGFAPDLAVGVYLGFDQPRSLGKNANGSTLAAPLFRDFMAKALADSPAIPFRIPPGVQLVRIDPKTGKKAAPGQKNTILEALSGDGYPDGHLADNRDPFGYSSGHDMQDQQPRGLY